MQAKYYRTEEETLRDFRRTFNIYNNSNTELALLSEVKTNWGIVDLLAIYFVKQKLEKRKAEIMGKGWEVPNFSKMAAYAMLFLNKHRLATLNELGTYLKIKKSKLLELVELLSSRNLVHVYKNDKVKVRSLENTFFISDIVAYEAKLRDWRRAISQAERHLWFTNNSYVVIPHMSEKVKFKILKSCEDRGIGLVSKSNDNIFIILQEPSSLGFFRSYFSWVLNELILDKICNDKSKSNSKNN